ncbi:hypothetical protein SAMN05216266_113155 [Amycolatopsis marina]|uniref:Pectate lyase superfamily protein n=1 Tax=Amycolatopsis marina TaxID=490629 RepID=A0A1I1BEI4_9PSEU|nr:hypothetical protein [Amycolatopsis marina]SFB48527.1 hypothetical protein SAMN05216266_113155 [Amycolatopsis marina]
MRHEPAGNQHTRRDLFRTGGALLAAAAAAPLLPATAVARTRPVAAGPAGPAAGWQSDVVHYGSGGKLVYVADRNGNRIPDFSFAGYRNGEAPLPEIPAVRTIGPVSGDNTAHIQAALNEVGQLEPDENGFRGAVLLRPGTYRVSGTIRVNRTGVVLRGSGESVDPAIGTIIRATGSSKQTYVIEVGGQTDEWTTEVPGTRTDVTSDFVQVGSRTFTVADTSQLSVGDNLIINHPCTQKWLNAIDGGGTGDKPSWGVGERPIIYNRYIRDIQGKEVTVCAPVFNHLDRSLAQSSVYVWDNTGLVHDVGIESLRVDIQASGAEDENHAQSGIRLRRVEDAWVRDVTVLHFSFAGIDTRAATRITVRDVRASHPRSRIAGGRRYNFNAGALAQQVLFQGLWASHARHAFVANGTSRTSGCVWQDGYNDSGYSESGGHHRWSQGLLLDNIKELNSNSGRGHVIALHCRGGQGTGHGWSSVHSVAWNCTVDNGKHVAVQRPPTAQNYAIGTTGKANANGWTKQPAGHIEGTNRGGLEPSSLYKAQLSERLT